MICYVRFICYQDDVDNTVHAKVCQNKKENVTTSTVEYRTINISLDNIKLAEFFLCVFNVIMIINTSD